MSFENIRCVLLNPSHPGNIGAAARALKTMHLHQLILVNPEEFPSSKATAMASGADDVLMDARIVTDLESAIAYRRNSEEETRRRRSKPPFPASFACRFPRSVRAEIDRYRAQTT